MRSIEPRDWIAVSDERALSDAPAWAPDGNALYYISDLDGFRCIWRQRLDPESKRPIGEPQAVFHAHNRRSSLGNLPVWDVDLAVGRDKLVFDMGELRGNIWIADAR